MSDILNIDLKRDDLGKKLGGGLPKASIILMEGEDGAGKSIMAQRLCYGLVQNNHTVSYISSELSLMEFVTQMKSVKYTVNDSIISHQLLFLSVFPYLGDARYSENFLDRLFSTRQIFAHDVIMLDTLSFLIIQDELSTQRAFHFIKLLKKITNMNRSLIICVDPTHINPQILTLIRSVADGYITLEIKTILGNLMRVAEIKRFRRTVNSVTPSISFNVEPKLGISIELSSLS